MRFYGGDLFYRSAWPTPDGVIPFKLFYLFISTAENLAARETWETAQAVTLGKALAENGKDSKVKRARRNLLKRAYPEVDL